MEALSSPTLNTATAVTSLALVAYRLALVQPSTGTEAPSPEVSGQLVRSRLEADGDRCLLAEMALLADDLIIIAAGQLAASDTVLRSVQAQLADNA